jgi:hypothetical protein
MAPHSPRNSASSPLPPLRSARLLAYLAKTRQVSPSHQQALCALLYPSYIH